MRTLIVILIALVLTNKAFGAEVRKPTEDIKITLDNMISAAEIKYDLPKGLLKALITTESSGNHKAKVRNDGVSHKTSYGLTQIQLDAARLVQKIKAKRDKVKLRNKDLITAKQLMVPETNIDYGAAYLSWLLDNHDSDIAWSLTCWNVGPNSDACKNKKYFGPYVGKVLNAYFQKK